MLVRVLGVVVVTIAGVFVAFSLLALTDTHEMAQFISDAGTALQQPMSASDWEKHWRVVTYSTLVLAAVLFVSGVAMLQRKRWAFALLGVALLISIVLDFVLYAVGYSKYAFEQPSLIETMIVGTITVWSFVAFFLWPKWQHMARGNT